MGESFLYSMVLWDLLHVAIICIASNLLGHALHESSLAAEFIEVHVHIVCKLILSATSFGCVAHDYWNFVRSSWRHIFPSQINWKATIVDDVDSVCPFHYQEVWHHIQVVTLYLIWKTRNDVVDMSLLKALSF